ncbi:12445_t:CDS:2, partial [Cetraspora pellucida]
DSSNDNERFNSIIRLELVKEYLEKAQDIVKKGRTQDRDEHVKHIQINKELNPKEKKFCLEYLRELIAEENFSQRVQFVQDPRSKKYYIRIYTYEMKIVKKINSLNEKSRQVIRTGPKVVALKLINGLNDQNNKLIEEVISRIKSFSQVSHGIKCHGLTKFPDKGKVVLLFDYMENGDLNAFLKYYQNIMKSCWDANPSERPSAETLFQHFSTDLEKMSCSKQVIPELETIFSRSHFHVANETISVTHEFVNLPEPKNETNL